MSKVKYFLLFYWWIPIVLCKYPDVKQISYSGKNSTLGDDSQSQTNLSEENGNYTENENTARPDAHKIISGNSTTLEISSIQNISVEINITKCCEDNEFFYTVTNECKVATENTKFFEEVKKIYNSSVFNTLNQKVENCPNTGIAEMHENSGYYISENGEIYDYFDDKFYNHHDYCLELIGESAESALLTLAYCPTRKNLIPKCCLQHGHYFDPNVRICIPFDAPNDTSEALLSAYLDDNSQFADPTVKCHEDTIEMNMDETYLRDGSLCMNKTDRCYNSDKFCIDIMSNDVSSDLIPASMLCPEFFIKKCCPMGESIVGVECTRSSEQSPYLIELLNNSLHYVSGFINSDSSFECTMIFLVQTNESEVSWTIDKEGMAIIDNKRSNQMTNKFCVDDDVNGADRNPVIKVCSEEVKVYTVETSLERYSENAQGKCCPPGMAFDSVTKQCTEMTADVEDLMEIDELRTNNISDLIFTGFPNCGDVGHHSYHSLVLGSTSNSDYVEFANQNFLTIITMENNCKIKETDLTTSMYCLEYKLQEHEYIPHAFICVPKIKVTHAEKSYIVVSLVTLSCVALILSLVFLLSMRVRRGMTTMRKVNTLAGRILMSYVLSLLVGYVVLGINSTVDFGGNNSICFILTGFLQFFMMAAFCWNTSICLEGFLLTMSIRTTEFKRYVLHSLWAWGAPGIITAFTLIIDHYSDRLPCSMIKPKIAMERCYFSSNSAMLLYFYLPITITVVLNGALLLSSKALRNIQLKKLQRSALSFKEDSGTPERQAASNSSKQTGMRTHQSKNMWMESFRLVVWSGGTWLLEVLGTLAAMFSGNSEGQWYSYLWYIPGGFNCLRGLGILYLILSTSESNSKYDRLFKLINCGFKKTPAEQAKKSDDHFGKSFTSDGREDSVRSSDERKLSTTTMISDLSAGTATVTDSPGQVRSKLYRSISQAVPEPFESESDYI